MRRLIAALAILLACSALNFGVGPYADLDSWGGGARLLDMQPAESGGEAMAVLMAFGSEGRDLYARFLAFDTLFLAANAMSLTLFAAFALSRLTRHYGWRVLALMPSALGALDLLENFGLFALLNSFPNDSLVAATWLGSVTRAKLALVPVAMLTVIGAWAVLGARSLWRWRDRLVQRGRAHSRDVAPPA